MNKIKKKLYNITNKGLNCLYFYQKFPNDSSFSKITFNIIIELSRIKTKCSEFTKIPITLVNNAIVLNKINI